MSGGKIRELLQERLRYPIYQNEDDKNTVRLFSSKTAYDIWNTPEGKDAYGDDLVLLEFTKPN